MYDNRVLLVEDIEKEGASSSAASNPANNTEANYHPSVPSAISKGLVGLVNGEYQKYLPKI